MHRVPGSIHRVLQCTSQRKNAHQSRETRVDTHCNGLCDALLPRAFFNLHEPIHSFDEICEVEILHFKSLHKVMKNLNNILSLNKERVKNFLFQ